jgi:hypothetical protein
MCKVLHVFSEVCNRFVWNTVVEVLHFKEALGHLLRAAPIGGGMSGWLHTITGFVFKWDK